MPVYQCFLIDSADKVQEVDTIESSSEADAVFRGEHMLRGASYAAAIEVWEHGRLIRHIERADFQEQRWHGRQGDDAGHWTQGLAIMRPANFDIVFRTDAWYFVTDEVTSRPYQTQAAAIHAAEAFVRGEGVDAHVRIYRFDGIRQEERIYSREMATAKDRQS